MSIRKPIAVLISDIHYNINTLPLADAALRQAITTANELEVPVIIAGDMHDSKANLRGECVNAMLETIKLCFARPRIIIGNHDRLNEKAPAHSLNFLFPYANIIHSPIYDKQLGVYLVPYHHDVDDLRGYLMNKIGDKETFILHQGITGSQSGDYIQDKSALSVDDVPGFRIISGHYHTRQTIQLPNGGVWDYLGNPFTLTYAEANDPPKGYQVLYNDGSLEFTPTNLRQHRVWDVNANLILDPICELSTHDLLWVRVTDTKERLQSCTKEYVSRELGLVGFSYRLDLIPTDTTTQQPDPRLNLSEGPLLDSLIDSLSGTSDERKGRLKDLWKGLK